MPFLLIFMILIFISVWKCTAPLLFIISSLTLCPEAESVSSLMLCQLTGLFNCLYTHRAEISIGWCLLLFCLESVLHIYLKSWKTCICIARETLQSAHWANPIWVSFQQRQEAEIFISLDQSCWNQLDNQHKQELARVGPNVTCPRWSNIWHTS